MMDIKKYEYVYSARFDLKENRVMVFKIKTSNINLKIREGDNKEVFFYKAKYFIVDEDIFINEEDAKKKALIDIKKRFNYKLETFIKERGHLEEALNGVKVKEL